MSKILSGIVVSNKMQKTIVVDVEKTFQHPKYRKVITRHKKFKVHCENENVKVGDKVVMIQIRPMSKEKHYMVVDPTVDSTKAEIVKEKKISPAKQAKIEQVIEVASTTENKLIKKVSAKAKKVAK